MLLNFFKTILNKLLTWLDLGSTSPSQNQNLSPIAPNLQELIDRQQRTYRDVFCVASLQSQFHQPTHHYDWWMFPMSVPEGTPVSENTRKFSINDQETLNLLHHQQFVSTYQQTIEKYVANLENFGWNNYDIRFAKMLQSLNQFIKIAQLHRAEPSIGNIYQQLCRLAQRSMDFANNHIPVRSHLFNRGMLSLEQALHLAKSYTPARDNSSLKSIATYGTRTKHVYLKVNKHPIPHL